MEPETKSDAVLIPTNHALFEDIKQKNLTYHMVTYGCAMNEHDSETICGILEQMGFAQGMDESADLVLFNTCCVRENAEQRLFGNVGALKQSKLDNKNKIIGVCGCMMQQDGAGEALKKRFPFVDIIFGTHNLQNLPAMVENALNHQKTVEVFDTDGYILEGLPVRRVNDFSAFINIMYGCNNFCSYCIVPYVRGRERSRHSRHIIDEAREIAAAGITEITLLGQNVNSYNRNGQDLSFPDLLRQLDQIDGLQRIRFLTSHPKDLSDDLIHAMTAGKHICPQLHLPVQSGDNEILKAMNRGYTVEHYLKRLEKIRAAIPNIGLTSDIIVGFPGETQQQFQHTLDLLRLAQFDGVFSFMYSARKGTRAELLPNQLSQKEKSDRLQALLAVQAEINDIKHKALEGQTFTVLAERTAKKQGQLSGRSASGLLINFPGNPEQIGTYVQVRIKRGLTNSLLGETE